MTLNNHQWNLELESKPDFEVSMQRIYAWYEQAIIDRTPVRFTRHNAEYEVHEHVWKPEWKDIKDRWLDVEYQIESFLQGIQGKHFHGETFPVFWPNLGPNFFASCFGVPIIFGEVTSWAQHDLESYSLPRRFNWQHDYMRKMVELTQTALQVCPGKFIVGYTDLHPGIDWLMAQRGSEQLCLDLYENPAPIKEYLDSCHQDFIPLYDYFDTMLKEHNQPSVTWMNIPSFGKMHIPSCDFATMISKRHFDEFVYPTLEKETLHMTHNVFHVDGKGVARHLDRILELPNLQAIQWVQGVGDDWPILQWLPLIRRIQAAGKSVVVDLDLKDLEAVISALRPEGLLLCVPSENEEQELEILKRVERW
jgi:hypothetical protein